MYAKNKNSKIKNILFKIILPPICRLWIAIKITIPVTKNKKTRAENGSENNDQKLLKIVCCSLYSLPVFRA